MVFYFAITPVGNSLETDCDCYVWLASLTNLLAWPFNSDATESVLAVQSAMSDPAFSGDSPAGLFMGPVLAITAIFVWQLSIQASILRQAINVHPAFSFIIVIGYTLVISVVLSGLLGPIFR